MRNVTLFTGQWADLDLETLAQKASEWGYDGLELASCPNHFNIEEATSDPAYVENVKKTLSDFGLRTWAISNHLEGQLVCDHNDERSDAFVPSALKGRHSEKNQWAIDRMKLTASAAEKLGVKTVTGFTGSSIWNSIYPWPPVSQETIDRGFRDFGNKWIPILDEFQKYGVKFALEVHPCEIAFDLYTSERALEAVQNHPAFGFNFDPSHLHWQMVDPVKFIERFSDRIFHVHVKDAQRNLDGKTSILSSHLPFGDPRRGWDFRSPGRGDIRFEEIFRRLNDIGYEGPLSVEWEDSGLDREFGAKEALEFVRKTDFRPSSRGFEESFKR